MTDFATAIEAQRIVKHELALAKEIVRQMNGRPLGGGLTRRQLDLIKFIRTYTGEHGTSPSFDEMKAALGLASKSGVHRLVLALEERGWINRFPDRARSISLRRVA